MKSRNPLILLLALALMATACGSTAEATVEAAPLIVVEGSEAPDVDASVDGPDATDTPTDQTNEELALEFTQCMRDEGVDLPDPTVNADGSIQLFQPGAISNIDPDDPAVANAVEVCGDLIAGASFLPGAGLDNPKSKTGFSVSLSACETWGSMWTTQISVVVSPAAQPESSVTISTRPTLPMLMLSESARQRSVRAVLWEGTTNASTYTRVQR